MISEENIATAQIAQIFGSELLKAQQSARTDSGSVPDFVKIHPQQFLVNQTAISSRKRAEEQRLIQMLQREAEAACPLPPESSQALPANTVSSPMLQTHSTNLPQAQSTILPQAPDMVVGKVTTTTHLTNTSSDVWERIANSLESIAASLARVDISVKKKKIKRTKSVNESTS